MKLGSTLLKAATLILSLLCLAYGLIVGIFNFGPEGLQNSIHWRMVGIYVFILGVSYLISNEKKTTTKTKYNLFLFLELSPVFVLLFAGISSIVFNGIDSFIKTGGFFTVLVLAVLSLLPPSYLFITQGPLTKIG